MSEKRNREEEDTVLLSVESAIMENRVKKNKLGDKTIGDLTNTVIKMFEGNESLLAKNLIDTMFRSYEDQKTEKLKSFIKLIKVFETVQNAKNNGTQTQKLYETKEFQEIENQKLDNIVFELKDYMIKNVESKTLIKNSLEFLNNKIRRLTETETSDINLLFENLKVPESTIKIFFEQLNVILKKIKDTKFEKDFYNEKKITIFKDSKKVNLEKINNKSDLSETLFNNHNTLGIFFWLLYIGQIDIANNLMIEYRIYMFCEETMNENLGFLKLDCKNDISFWQHNFINLFKLVEIPNMEKIKKSVTESNKYKSICESLKKSFLSRQDKRFLKQLENSLMMETYIGSFEEEQRDYFVEDFKIWMNSQ